MSNHAYEILCPSCRRPLPADAKRCPSCSGGTAESAAVASAALATPIETDEIAKLGLKDYHQLVQATHAVNEGYRTTGLGSPIVPVLGLVVLGVAVALAFLLGWF
jgi:hypothetical protein